MLYFSCYTLQDALCVFSFVMQAECEALRAQAAKWEADAKRKEQLEVWMSS